ncbi:MAG TPA: KamA family radical SAM protein [Bacteriovoracaceae bacterium]|nr:KamA family radical SAM protein [Bacteriovoracaceae bacterium]
MHNRVDWTRSFAAAIKTVEELHTFLGWEAGPGVTSAHASFPVFVPVALAEKIKAQGPSGPLAKEFLPHSDEVDPRLNSQGLTDPIGDRSYQRAPQLIHRYPSRALFTATSVCPVHCRYCFRRNELSHGDELFSGQFSETLSYLRAHPEVSEIIFTGGDPLTLSNEKLDRYLMAFGEISSIKDVRFHTRYPVILPERIDDGFIELLRKASSHFRTVSVAIHANHSSEFDPQNTEAIRKLAASPVQLLSQTVLLKNVNDNSSDLIELINTFIGLKIRPYYLHHPDRVRGGMHFYLSLETGRRIYQSLRSSLPGWAVPLYVVDIPGGHGKVSAFNPEATAFSGQLLSQSGESIYVSEPGL